MYVPKSNRLSNASFYNSTNPTSLLKEAYNLQETILACILGASLRLPSSGHNSNNYESMYTHATLDVVILQHRHTFERDNYDSFRRTAL